MKHFLHKFFCSKNFTQSSQTFKCSLGKLSWITSTLPPSTAHLATRSQKFVCLITKKNEEDQAFEVQGRGQPGHRERGSLKLFSRSASCNGRVLSAFSGGKRAIGAGKTHYMESNQKIMALVAKNCFRRPGPSGVGVCACAPVYWSVNAQKCAPSLFIILYPFGCCGRPIQTFKHGQATNIYG